MKLLEKFNYFGGLTVASWLLLVLIILSQLFAPFKAGLASVFSHHWIGKIVIVTIVFALYGFFVKDYLNNEKIAFNSTIASLALMLAFFTLEFFQVL